MKVAFLYAGQGAQYVGMGKDLYENFSEAKEVFNKANDVLGFSITDVCFNNEEKINITEFTQPAIVTVSVAINEILKAKNIKADCVAGLSLGEYTAVHASGAVSFEEIVKLVNVRGKIMQEAVPAGVGKMAVILGLADDVVLDVCNSISTEGNIIEPANYNCPGQVVVGGHIDAVDKLMVAAKEAGAKRVLPIAVSVPSHTSVMKEAAKKFKDELTSIDIKETTMPLYANVTGSIQSDSDIKDNLEKQMMTSTYMGKIIKNMIEDGVDTFIEIGPGKTLTGFVRNIVRGMDKEIKYANIQDTETLNKAIEILGGNK